MKKFLHRGSLLLLGSFFTRLKKQNKIFYKNKKLLNEGKGQIRGNSDRKKYVHTPNKNYL